MADADRLRQMEDQRLEKVFPRTACRSFNDGAQRGQFVRGDRLLLLWRGITRLVVHAAPPRHYRRTSFVGGL
jgi:hypothetical protein